MSDEILINQLFAGSYLDEGMNIGHEVINLFKDDNGDNYLYITPSGVVDQKAHPVKSVIFVRNVEKKTTVEVIAKAEALSAPRDADEIRYAGTTLDTIFRSNTYHGKSQAGWWTNCTFKTDKIRLPKAGTRIMLTLDENFAPEGSSVRLIRLHSNSRAISNQSARKYYSIVNDPEAYRELEALLQDDSYWEPENTTKQLIADGSTRRPSPSFLEIIRKDNDELSFSNLFAYYFQYDRTIFQNFVKDVLSIPNFKPNFNIVRETNNNIDLWIENNNQILVIENKIKSGLNGIKSDNYSQLNKYQNYTEARITDREDECFGKNAHYFIFTPDYNLFDISKYALDKPYKIIKYSEIYSFFAKNAAKYLDEKYFSDFLKGLKNHTMSMSEYNFSIMRSRFLEKINQA